MILKFMLSSSGMTPNSFRDSEPHKHRQKYKNTTTAQTHGLIKSQAGCPWITHGTYSSHHTNFTSFGRNSFEDFVPTTTSPHKYVQKTSKRKKKSFLYWKLWFYLEISFVNLQKSRAVSAFKISCEPHGTRGPSREGAFWYANATPWGVCARMFSGCVLMNVLGFSVSLYLFVHALWHDIFIEIMLESAERERGKGDRECVGDCMCRMNVRVCTHTYSPCVWFNVHHLWGCCDQKRDNPLKC